MPSLELEDRFISIRRVCGMGGKENVGTVKTSLCSKSEVMFPEQSRTHVCQKYEYNLKAYA
jgi:hypothetical protein